MVLAPDARLLLEKMRKRLLDESKTREAFYEWLSDEVKAEFINGKIVMHSPVKRRHLTVSENLFTLLRVYVVDNNLGIVSAEKALIALTRNDYEPDLCFWGVEKAAYFEPDLMKHPAADFIVEILSKSTEERDRGVKYQDYAAHGVREYWLSDPYEDRVEQYLLLPESPTRYTLRNKYAKSDRIESEVVTGFDIPVVAIFDTDHCMVTLQELLAKKP